jgi:hypothetical protein
LQRRFDRLLGDAPGQSCLRRHARRYRLGRGAGKAPRRDGWDGLLPASGDGSREWSDFVQPEELPRRINPPETFLATAIELNAPDFLHLACKENERSRIERIREVLGEQQCHSRGLGQQPGRQRTGAIRQRGIRAL